MFEQDLEILFQRSNLLLARLQLVSKLPEGIFDFFFAHAYKMIHRQPNSIFYLTEIFSMHSPRFLPFKLRVSQSNVSQVRRKEPTKTNPFPHKRPDRSLD
jgi:hypothetical protein